MVSLNEGQKYAIKCAIDWYYNNKDEKRIFVISGVAGSGKTYLVNALVNILGLASYQVIYTSFTGKAVEILRRKRLEAETIHKTFYSVRKINGKIRFAKKKQLSSMTKLIIIDELSMVNDRIMGDILSFGIPIIGLGDNAQLPPIYGTNNYMDNPDVQLKEIMRQKGDKGILDLAALARGGESIPFGNYIESKVIRVKDIDNIEKYDVVLCWKNSTRMNLNISIRKKIGYESIYPLRREKLICLKNNYVHLIEVGENPIFLVNGMDLVSNRTVKIDKDDIRDSFELSYYSSYSPGVVFNTRVHRGPFDAYETGRNYVISGEEDEDIVFLDYGYAYTVHKSQGSEFNNVLIIDEFKGASDMYNKWLYTAITRARESVTIARYY
jgi:exodeoxyribonuclease-5